MNALAPVPGGGCAGHSEYVYHTRDPDYLAQIRGSVDQNCIITTAWDYYYPLIQKERTGYVTGAMVGIIQHGLDVHTLTGVADYTWTGEFCDATVTAVVAVPAPGWTKTQSNSGSEQGAVCSFDATVSFIQGNLVDTVDIETASNGVYSCIVNAPASTGRACRWLWDESNVDSEAFVENALQPMPAALPGESLLVPILPPT